MICKDQNHHHHYLAVIKAPCWSCWINIFSTMSAWGLLSLFSASDVGCEASFSAYWWAQSLDPRHPLIQHWRAPSSVIQPRSPWQSLWLPPRAPLSVLSSPLPWPALPRTSQKKYTRSHTRTQNLQCVGRLIALPTRDITNGATYGSSWGWAASHLFTSFDCIEGEQKIRQEEECVVCKTTSVKHM